MQFTLIINQIMILFLMILIGYIIRKKGIINEEITKGLSILLIEIILPALIISSMSINIDRNLAKYFIIFFILNLIIYLSVIIIATFLPKILTVSRKKKTIINYLLVFGNVGYMGFPVINTIYPEKGLFFAVINNFIITILMWTYGIYIFIKDNNTENKIHIKNLFNNGIIAITIGFLIFFTGYQLPIIISGMLEGLGNMTFPLSMLIIGSSLTNVKFKSILTDKYLYLYCSLKLLILPLIAFYIIKNLNLPPIIFTITIILLAMPAGANSVLFAEKYDGDYKFASEGVFMSTFFSLFTIPFLIWLINL
jgi:malate permease and related proteins